MRSKSMASVVSLGVLVASFAFLNLNLAQGSNHRTLRAELDGANEVCDLATCNDPNGTGRAVVQLDGQNNRVCFTLRWAFIQAPYGAHIHRGAAGTEGPVKVTLFTARDLSRGVRTVGGCARGVDDALMNRILDNPQGFYVNIHTPFYEGGAIRGQLHQ
jgi:CHRD domain